MNIQALKIELAENGVIVYEGGRVDTLYHEKIYVFTEPLQFEDFMGEWFENHMNKDD